MIVKVDIHYEEQSIKKSVEFENCNSVEQRGFKVLYALGYAGPAEVIEEEIRM